MPEKTLTCPRCLSVSPVSAGKCLNCGLPMVRKKKKAKTGSKDPSVTPPPASAGAPGERPTQKTSVQKTVFMSPEEKKEVLTSPERQSAQGAPPDKESVTQKTVFMSDKEKKRLMAKKMQRKKEKKKRPGFPVEPESPPRMRGLQLFEDVDQDSEANIGSMRGIERTGGKDLRAPTTPPETRAPGAGQKKPAPPKPEPARTIKGKKEKRKTSAPDPFALPEEENGSLLDLLQDTHETGGEHFARQQSQQRAPKGKLDLVKRKPEPKSKVVKAPIVRPTPPSVTDEEIILNSHRSGFLARLVFRVVPQLILLAVIALVGFTYIHSIMFTGTWQGVVTDNQGREVEIELILRRHGNQIEGEASYARPEGETILTPIQNSGIPRVIHQVMVNQEGYIIGNFDKKSASFKLYPPGVTNEPSIQFEGEFMSRNLLQGSARNSFQARGSFMLRRISTWKLPFGLKLP